jgi:DNA-directed RNA polymerase subunit K/omega
MADNTPKRVSIEEDPYLAVCVGAAEARRVNETLRQLNGDRYLNPVLIAYERLEAGLLRYTIGEPEPWQPTEGTSAETEVMPTPSDPLLDGMGADSAPAPDGTSPAPELDPARNAEEDGESEDSLQVPEVTFGRPGPGIRGRAPSPEQPCENDARKQERGEVPDQLPGEHREGDGHQSEVTEVAGDRRNQPHPEPEPQSPPPTQATDGRTDAPVHVGKAEAKEEVHHR